MDRPTCFSCPALDRSRAEANVIGTCQAGPPTLHTVLVPGQLPGTVMVQMISGFPTVQRGQVCVCHPRWLEYADAFELEPEPAAPESPEANGSRPRPAPRLIV